MEMEVVKEGHGAAAVVLDVDGVLHKGPEPIAGAREALERLEAAGVPFIFVTNSGGETEEGKAAHYRRLLGWDAISPARLVQSHTPMRGLLPRFADRPVLAVGSSVASATRVMTKYGHRLFYLFFSIYYKIIIIIINIKPI
jgi:HAD superfamily hydrolase (TIGR01450 family)